MSLAHLPTLTVEIDFTNAPTNATRSWTDVTAYVRRADYTRAGRNDELARTEPGVLNELILDNNDGRFSPDNASGPYYPNVKRNRWCRISATWSATTYRRWTGLITGFGRSWMGAGADATTKCTGVDILAALNLIGLDTTLVSSPTELTGERVASILDLLPAVAQDVATGTVSIPAVTYETGAFALPHLLAVEDTEGGLLFADGDGTVRFQGRNYRYTNTRANTSQATISDDGGASSIPYTPELDEELDDAFWYNTATITPAEGDPETWENTTATATDLPRGITGEILSTLQSEAVNRAQYLVQQYAEPGARIPQLRLIPPANSSPPWAAVLSARNSDRFTWELGSITRAGYLERVSEVVTPGTWETTFNLSPADDDSIWIAGTSELGVDTYAAY